MNEFEPKIIGFLCNWCSYAGADLAGVSRFQYPPTLRPVRVMCSTRVASHLILEIFRAGADGVLVGGCHIGDCHYINGNLYTIRRVKMARKLMELAGIEPERLGLEWISASEGEKFARVVTEFTEQIRQLGPTPVRGNEKLQMRLSAAINAAKTFRLKALNGKELKVTEQGNVYGEVIDQQRFDEIFESAAEEEFTRSMILELTSNTPRSVVEMAEEIGAMPEEILDHVSTLRERNMIALDSVEDFTPRYRALMAGGV